MGKIAKPDEATRASAEWLARTLKFVPDSLFDLLASYFRLEVEGIENLPDKGRGRMLIVPNHSNALGFDAFMMVMALKKFTRRVPRVMGHNFWFSNGFSAAFSRRCATVPRAKSIRPEVAMSRRCTTRASGQRVATRALRQSCLSSPRPGTASRPAGLSTTMKSLSSCRNVHPGHSCMGRA